MENVPQFPDDRPSPLVQAGIYLLVPVILLLAIPFLLLLIVVLHFAAIFYGGRILVFSINGRMETLESDVPKPHFLERQNAPQSLPDESQTSPT